MQQSHPLDWKWEVIWDNISPETNQQLSYTKEQLFNSMFLEWQSGEIAIYGIAKERAVVLVRPSSEFVADVHIFAETNANWSIVKAFRRLITWGWHNTPYIKLEMRTPLTKVCALARRLGFKQEGIRKLSYVTTSGDILDEFEYGLTRPEEISWVRR